MPVASVQASLFTLSVMLFAQAAEVADPPWASTPPRVVGSDRFVKQVESALRLIKTRSPETHRLVQHNVAIISQCKRSGMWAYKNPPVYEMADATTFYSVTWCAATIAHDALHSKLYHDYLAAHGKPVPSDVWTGREAEIKCISFQLEVLRKIEASQHEVDYCAKLNGEHYDADRDGKYEWEDYFKRDW
jgi:hypothetical protein